MGEDEITDTKCACKFICGGGENFLKTTANAPMVRRLRG